MNTVTVNISEEIFRAYEKLATELNVPAARLIDQALRRSELRRKARERRAQQERSSTSLRDIKTASLGKTLKPWNSRAELLEGFLDREEPDDRT